MSEKKSHFRLPTVLAHGTLLKDHVEEYMLTCQKPVKQYLMYSH